MTLALQLPEWQERGRCKTDRSVDPRIFFPEGDEATAQSFAAKRVCAKCPVRELCLQYALDENIKYGVWGGTSYNDRRKIKRQIRNNDVA